ncbi:hypothetical protein HAX54_029407 [Datura stramonium]|uniref:Uncharacterized protein n=1 Tax=Datura stramonium TaxID=4076 RepID=A0ABS8V8I0_DATST|nr:hypothetical protein [Datura stramonium]
MRGGGSLSRAGEGGAWSGTTHRIFMENLAQLNFPLEEELNETRQVEAARRVEEARLDIATQFAATLMKGIGRALIIEQNAIKECTLRGGVREKGGRLL